MRRRRLSFWGFLLVALGLAVGLGVGPGTTGAQDVLPTPRGQLGGPMPLQLTPEPPVPAQATSTPSPTEEPSPTEVSDTPTADDCDVEPRSLETLFALAGTPTAGEATPDANETPIAWSEGESADAETIAGIRATLDELAACEATGDGLRVLALYSDDFVRDLFALRLAGLSPEESERFESGSFWAITVGTFPVVRDEDLRVLTDGRVGAPLRLAEEETEPMRGGAEAGDFILFVESDERWLIDEYVVTGDDAMTPDASGGGGASLPAPVEAALQAAAVELGVGVDALTVVSMERREWPDTGLGCPQPGEFYAQVITPGYLVIVQGAGRELEYHTDDGTNVVLCAGQ